MIRSTAELRNKGVQCLIEGLGIVEMERFLAEMSREPFDYTKWQQSHYEALKPGEFMQNAAAYAQTHPFEGKARRLKLP